MPLFAWGTIDSSSMTKKRRGDAWMPATQYAHTLKGLTLNLLVRDIALALPFHCEVLGAKLVYSDPDIAVFRYQAGRCPWPSES